MAWVKRMWRGYLAKIRDPIITDRSVDLMCAVYWFCIGAWGISASVAGLRTIDEGASDLYGLIWGASLGIVATVAFSAAASMFLTTPNITHRITKKKIEMWAASISGGLISVYPILVMIAVFGPEQDWSRFSTVFVALTYMIIPTWRVRHLYHRISGLREVANTADSPLPTTEDER